MNYIQFVKIRTQHTLLYPALLVLVHVLTNSSESNPGPRTPRYSCQVCPKTVTWKDGEVACDDCSKWYYVECLQMLTRMFNTLASSSISWRCATCLMPNFSTFLFASIAINFSFNIFEHLTDSNIFSRYGHPAVTS